MKLNWIKYRGIENVRNSKVSRAYSLCHSWMRYVYILAKIDVGGLLMIDVKKLTIQELAFRLGEMLGAIFVKDKVIENYMIGNEIVTRLSDCHDIIKQLIMVAEEAIVHPHPNKISLGDAIAIVERAKKIIGE
jgi:hypothetical protein